jgi:hypothetical protein
MQAVETLTPTVSSPSPPRRAAGRVLWYVAFFAVLVAGDRLGGLLLARQVEQSQFRYSRLYQGSAGADVLLVGNSRGLTFYQPYIEQVTGKRTFNLSYNGLPMDLARALAEDYLDRYPAPRKVVIDITTCDRENDELLTGFLPYTPYSPRIDALIRGKEPKVWWGSRVSSLFRYNNEVFQRALFHRRQSDKDWLLDRVIAPDLAAAVAENNYPLEIHPYLIDQLAGLVEAARAKGAEVELVISPYFPGFARNVSNLDALKAEVEQRTGLAVRDYRQALNDPHEFGDFMHPNKKGSQAYIDMLVSDAVIE